MRDDDTVRILVLGGTAFVGRAVVDAALRRGWEVTTFNRGHTGPDPAGVRVVRGDRTLTGDVHRLVSAGSWDAVIDSSIYVPRNALLVARLLAEVVDRYVCVSTVSVYTDWPLHPLTEASELLRCPPDAGPDFGEDIENGPTRYGYQKAGCETAIVAALGAERTTILRPGVILGPHEYVGRLPWWLRRIAAGGTVVAPGPSHRGIQPVDVRDLAEFTLDCVRAGRGGAFNIAAPIDRETFGGLLAACKDATRSDAEIVWADDEHLLRAGVRQWSELPLWRASAGVWQVDSARAQSLGLKCRPLRETVGDTWRWLSTSGDGENHARSDGIGLTREHERALLTLLGHGIRHE